MYQPDKVEKLLYVDAASVSGSNHDQDKLLQMHSKVPTNVVLGLDPKRAAQIFAQKSWRMPAPTSVIHQREKSAGIDCGSRRIQPKTNRNKLGKIAAIQKTAIENFGQLVDKLSNREKKERERFRKMLLISGKCKQIRRQQAIARARRPRRRLEKITRKINTAIAEGKYDFLSQKPNQIQSKPRRYFL